MFWHRRKEKMSDIGYNMCLRYRRFDDSDTIGAGLRAAITCCCLVLMLLDLVWVLDAILVVVRLERVVTEATCRGPAPWKTIGTIYYIILGTIQSINNSISDMISCPMILRYKVRYRNRYSVSSGTISLQISQPINGRFVLEKIFCWHFSRPWPKWPSALVFSLALNIVRLLSKPARNQERDQGFTKPPKIKQSMPSHSLRAGWRVYSWFLGMCRASKRLRGR